MTKDERLKKIQRLKEIQSVKFLAAGQDATGVGSERPKQEGVPFPHQPDEFFMNRLRTLGNAPQNFTEFVSNVAAAATSPVETVKGLAFAAQQLPYEVFRKGLEKFTGAPLPEFTELPGIRKDTPSVGKAILDDFSERYGSLGAIDKTMTEHTSGPWDWLAGDHCSDKKKCHSRTLVSMAERQKSKHGRDLGPKQVLVPFAKVQAKQAHLITGISLEIHGSLADEALIAAAPDLLAACEWVAKAWHDRAFYGGSRSDFSGPGSAVEAAIAKARKDGA